MIALAIASFHAAEPFRQAIADARARDRAIVGLWSPMPVEVPEAPTDAGRAIRPVMAAAGLLGAAAFYLLTWWSAVFAYSFDSGNRPLHSWPAFLVAPVELGALVAGFAGLLAFGWRAGLSRLYHPAFDLDEVSRAAEGAYVIAIRCEAGEDANSMIALLGQAGAAHSRIVAP